MNNNEFEITYFSLEHDEWLKTLTGLVESFVNKSSNPTYRFKNFIYFLIDNDDDTQKEKIVFKLDDSHILFRLANKKLAFAEGTDVQYYLEKKEKWHPLSEFDVSILNNRPFFVYYKEKVVCKVNQNCSRLSFVADDVFFVDFNRMKIVENIKYIEVESDDIRVLKSNRQFFDYYIENNSIFQPLTDEHSKYAICKKRSLQWQGEIHSICELEKKLNVLFTNLYLYNIESAL